MPDNVILADKLLSEYYAARAYNFSVQASADGMKSETYDDYSYTKSDASGLTYSEDDLNLASLLDEFIIPEATGKVLFRMRKI